MCRGSGVWGNGTSFTANRDGHTTPYWAFGQKTEIGEVSGDFVDLRGFVDEAGGATPGSSA